MLWIHIAGGLAALLAGLVALYVRKGGGTHKSWGRVFVYAMFVMTISGAIIAGLLNPNPGNVLAAATSFYLVATGWLTVRPGAKGARGRHQGLCLLGFLVGVYGIGLAAFAFQAPGNAINGIPAVAMVIFAMTALLGATADLRLLRGRIVDGSGRLLRHLWRMGLALWIATGSFFFGQADEFPEAVREAGVLSIPVVAVAATLVFWAGRQMLISHRAKRGRLNTAASTPLSPR